MRNFSDEIIGQSRHQFIYGENGKMREDLLRGIVRDNPIVCDCNVPGVIYLENDYLNHRKAQQEAEEELEMKEQGQNENAVEERMGKLEEKLLTVDNVSLSAQEAKIIQDVLKEFLT